MRGVRRIRRCSSARLRLCSGTRSRTSGSTGGVHRCWRGRCGLLRLLQLRLQLVTTLLVLDNGFELGGTLDNIGQSILRRRLYADSAGAATTTYVGRRFTVISVEAGQGWESGCLQVELHAATATAAAVAVAAAASARWQGFLNRRQRMVVPGRHLRVLIFGPAMDTVAGKRRRRGGCGGGLDRRRCVLVLRGGQRGGSSLYVFDRRHSGRRRMELCAGLVGRRGRRDGRL